MKKRLCVSLLPLLVLLLGPGDQSVPSYLVAADQGHPNGGLIPITISPNALEVEKRGGTGVALVGTTVTTTLGTNMFPSNLGGIDPILNLPLFSNDALFTFLNLSDPAIADAQLDNTDGVDFVDWVHDTLPNNDSPSLVDGIAVGIEPGTSGTTFNNQKRGHWNGGRLVDGIGNADLDTFTKGGKEDDPTTWTVGPGSVAGKYDITQVYIASSISATSDLADFPTGRKAVLYFGMERRGNSGTTAFDFEFDQLAPFSQYIPHRTEGDVLFTFEMNGSGSSGSAVPHVYVYHNGSFLNNEILASSLPVARRPLASINQTSTPSAPWGYVNDKGLWTIGQIPVFSVCKAAIPFGVDFLNGIGGCGAHDFLQIRTRSSVTNTSVLKDATRFIPLVSADPHSDLRLQSGCDQSFQYAALGSFDPTGGNNLVYDWRFQVPAGCQLQSSDPGFAQDPFDPTRYSAEFVSDSIRNVSVLLPAGVDVADVVCSLTVRSAGSCSDSTLNFDVRVFRSLHASASLGSPGGNQINYSSSVTGGNAPYSYSWSFYKVGSPDVQIGTSSSASGSFSAPSSGTYYGVLTVQDTSDTSSDSHVISKGQCSTLAATNQLVVGASQFAWEASAASSKQVSGFATWAYQVRHQPSHASRLDGWYSL